MQLKTLLSLTDTAHLLYGSDFPYVPVQALLAKKKHLEENPEYAYVISEAFFANGEKILHR